MSVTPIDKTISKNSEITSQSSSSEETQQTFTSYKKFEPKSPVQNQQFKIKLNIPPVSTNIESSSPHFQSISIRLNPILPTSTEPKTFKSEFYYNPKLEEEIAKYQPILHVDLSYWRLIDQDILTIVKQIIIDKKCTELWLYGNHITSQGATTLASSLKKNSSLKSLDLSFNHISDIGVGSLTKVLIPNENSSVKILHLSKNGITDDGAKYLSEMLKVNETLTELWLSNNEISNEGIKRLANVLSYHNKTLKYLSLSMNIFITDLSIDYLIGMFEHNQTLKKLWMTDCNLTEPGKMKLREKINGKKRFQIEL